MSDKKNIDNLFQEKFENFETIPPEIVWTNIKTELEKDKKDRKIIPFWWKIAGISAVLFIGIFIGSNFNSNNNSNKVVATESPNSETKNTTNKNSKELINPKINEQVESSKNPITKISENEIASDENSENNKTNVNSEKNNFQINAIAKKNIASKEVFKNKLNNNKKQISKNRNLDATILTTEKNIASKNKFQNIDNQSNLVTKNNSIQEKRNDKNFANTENQKLFGSEKQKSNQNTPELENQKVNINKNDIAQNIKSDTTKIAKVVTNALEELLNEKESKTVNKVPKLNRWQVTSSIAPIYFGTTSNGSPLDPTLNENQKSFNTNFSYGAGVAYSVNKRFSVRSSLNKVTLDYNTNDIVFYADLKSARLQNVTNNNNVNIKIENKAKITNQEASFSGKNEGFINQKIGYIEIPVEMSYKLLDKKFGVNINGGLSTLLLNENTVSVVSSDKYMFLGEANNLNKMHFSTNIGLGFKYSFYKAFQINIDPMLKYQLKTFSNDSGNFKPYFFGIYSGFSYSF